MTKKINKNKIKQSHHWVPRFYLEYFSIPNTQHTKNPQIWVISNKEGDPFITGVRQVAAKNFLYSPKNIDNQRNQDAEDLLGDIESFISKIWYDLANKEINWDSTSTRRVILIFIVTLYLRNIKQLEDIRELKQKLLNLFDSLPKDEYGNPLIDSIQMNDQIIKINRLTYNDYKYPPYDIDHQMFVNSIFENTFDIVKILINKKWTIISNDESKFITTDNPVVIVNEKSKKFGFATNGTKLLFPFSPKYILLLHDDNSLLDGRYYHAEFPELYNLILWQNSYNFMFSPRNTDEVLIELEKFMP